MHKLCCQRLEVFSERLDHDPHGIADRRALCRILRQFRQRSGELQDIYAMTEAQQRLLARTDWGFVHQNAADGLRMDVSAGANVGERLMGQGERRYATPLVFVFALVLGVLAMAILVLWINTLTALLTFASLIGYAVVYTAWLKRATPQNIVIGGLAGAAPPLLGWVAATGHLSAELAGDGNPAAAADG